MKTCLPNGRRLTGPDFLSHDVRDASVIHRWAARLPWWLHVLVSPWLPELPEVEW